MNRLFTFGCSYTGYHFPTWANYFGLAFDRHIQYGRSGAGNRYIFNSFIHALHKYNISSNDYVSISWTSFLREDRIFNKDDSWNVTGNIYSQHVYPDEWVDNYFNPIQNIVEFLGYIKSLLAFQKALGFKLLMFNMSEYKIPGLFGEPSYVPDDKLKQHIKYTEELGLQDLINSIEELNFLPSIHSTVTKVDSNPVRYFINDNKIYIDLHPTSTTQLKYVRTIIQKNVDFDIFENVNYTDVYNIAKTWDNYFSDINKVKDNKFENLLFPHILCKKDFIYEPEITNYK